MNTSPSTTSVVIDAFDDPLTLDPHKAFDTASRHPVLNLYDGLLGLDDDRRLYPVLAAALPTTQERGRGWEVVVPIRDGVRFHDGAPLRVEDVVYSLRRMAITADGPAALWGGGAAGRARAALVPTGGRGYGASDHGH